MQIASRADGITNQSVEVLIPLFVSSVVSVFVFVSSVFSVVSVDVFSKAYVEIMLLFSAFLTSSRETYPVFKYSSLPESLIVFA